MAGVHIDMITDPIERIVATALRDSGISFIHEMDDPLGLTQRLDFYVPSLDLHIEVKQFHTPRVERQLSRVTNVILIQGRKAAEAFALMIAKKD